MNIPRNMTNKINRINGPKNQSKPILHTINSKWEQMTKSLNSRSKNVFVKIGKLISIVLAYV